MCMTEAQATFKFFFSGVFWKRKNTENRNMCTSSNASLTCVVNSHPSTSMTSEPQAGGFGRWDGNLLHTKARTHARTCDAIDRAASHRLTGNRIARDRTDTLSSDRCASLQGSWRGQVTCTLRARLMETLIADRHAPMSCFVRPPSQIFWVFYQSS